MIVTHWSRLFDPVGREQEISWQDLVEFLGTRTEFRGRDLHPGWSPARFSPCERSLENAREVHAICFDFDKGESIGPVVRRAKTMGRGLMHTTRSHRFGENGDRFRIVLALSRPCSGFEFGELWKRVAPVMGSVDQAPKDPSRFWYAPGAIVGAEFSSEAWEGDPLDVDAWLKKPDPTLPRAPKVEPRSERTSVEDRARKYIARMPEAIAGQGGHQATWDVALVLCRGFELSEDRAFALICEYNARCLPPWSERELRHKVKSAAKARVPAGFLLERSDEWRVYKSTMPPVPPEDDGFVSEPPEDWQDPAAGEGEQAAPEQREPGDDTGEPVPEMSAVDRYGVADVRAVFFEVLSVVRSGAAARGHTTGHYEIDGLLCGLRPSLVTLLAAATSWGKSSWGVMVADENLKASVPVLVVSVEDSRLMYGKRIVARRTGVNAIRIRDNACDPDDERKIERAAMQAPSEPFYLDARGKTAEWAAQAITEICNERGVGVVVCDYVQRFRTEKHSNDRRRQVGYVAELLSDAGKLGGAHTVILSQLKRIEGREPTMDDVKESGDLENMADHVLLGHKTRSNRPYYEGEEPKMDRWLFVPKNKDGPTHTGKILMPFNEVTASFDTVPMDSRFANAANDADRAMKGNWR